MVKKLTNEELELLKNTRKAVKTSYAWLGGYSRVRDLFNIIARQNNLKPIKEIIPALVLIFLLNNCCGEGVDFVLCWKHTPLRTANGQLVHRSGTHYWDAK